MPTTSRSYGNGPNDPPGSTKNVGGSKPARGGGDPFAYLKLGPNHAYLGHFRSQKFLQEGHNQAVMETGGGFRTPAPALSRRVGGSRLRQTKTAGVVKFRGKKVLLSERPVLAARAAGRAALGEAKRARRAAAPGAERKTARAAVQSVRAAKHAGVVSARRGAESAVSERRARRGVYKTFS